MMKCEDYLEELRSERPLTEELAARLVRHFDGCPTCQQRAEREYALYRPLFDRIPADEGPAEEDFPTLHGLEARVLARINAAAGSISQAPSSQRVAAGEEPEQLIYLQLGPLVSRAGGRPLAAGAYLSAAPTLSEEPAWDLEVPALEVHRAIQAAPWWDGTLAVFPRPHGTGLVRFRVQAGIASGKEDRGELRVSLQHGDRSWTIRLSWRKPTAYLVEDFPISYGPADFACRVAISSSRGE